MFSAMARITSLAAARSWVNSLPPRPRPAAWLPPEYTRTERAPVGCGGGAGLRRRQRRLPLAQLLEHPRGVGGDVAGEGGGGDGERRGEPEAAGAGAPLVVAVDRRDRDLVGGLRDPRAATDAGAAAGVDQGDPGAQEGVGKAVVIDELLDRRRAALDEELDPGSHL